ncbi:MAG TPA: TlpA disulfide reductase family protein, partial [Planctomycetaceae bacterium]|nr:TlpA disulfide reductase family protein [Planctomycetaceae bacterium]
DSLAGEVRVLIAWATWCVPCSRKAPELVELHNRFADRGVHFFGLTAAPEQYRDLILEWLEARKITWPNGFGEQAIETLLAYESDVIPLIWVIGRDGTVVWNRSLEAEEPLEQAIERALEQPRVEQNGAAALHPRGDSP